MGEGKIVCEKFQIKCPEERSTKRYGFGIRHVQMICMCQCMLALFIVRSSLGVAILAMTDVSRRNDSNVEIFEWDKKTQGLVLSSFFWGYMFMQIPAGILSKKYGGKLIMLVALLANGLLCLIVPILASVGGWKLVCLCRVAMGLTQACLFPASHTLLGKWLPENERTALSGFVYGGGSLGTIIAMPVSGLLAETAMGWKLIFYSTSGLMLFTAAIWFVFAASSPAEHRFISKEEKEYLEMNICSSTANSTTSATPWKAIVQCVPLWAIIIAHMGSAFTFTLFFVDLPTYLEQALGISLKQSASLSALPYFGMYIGSITSSIVGGKLYNHGLLSLIACRKLLTTIGLCGYGVGLIAMCFLSRENTALAVVVVVGTLTLSGGVTGGIMVNHLDLSPQFAGVLLSITNFAASVASIFTPVMTGFVLKDNPSDMSRWRIVFIVTACFSIGANIVYLIIGSAERQAFDSPDFMDRKHASLEEVTPMTEKEKEARKQTDTV